jgi:hypothetical protein
MLYIIFYTCFVLTTACPDNREGCLVNHSPYQVEETGNKIFNDKTDLDKFIESQKMKCYRVYVMDAKQVFGVNKVPLPQVPPNVTIQ